VFGAYCPNQQKAPVIAGAVVWRSIRRIHRA
jgi:hypothetical protein